MIIGKNFTDNTATASKSRIYGKRCVMGPSSFSIPSIQSADEVVRTNTRDTMRIFTSRIEDSSPRVNPSRETLIGNGSST